MDDKDQPQQPKNGQNHEQGQKDEEQDESIVVIDSPPPTSTVNPHQQNNITIRFRKKAEILGLNLKSLMKIEKEKP